MLAADALDPGSVWPPPPERVSGELSTVVEGTVLVQKAYSLTVDLVGHRRSIVVGCVMFNILMPAMLALPFIFIAYTDPRVRSAVWRTAHAEAALAMSLALIVAYMIFFNALMWILYNYRLGRCWYCFDREAQCLTSGSHKRYEFGRFRAVEVRWVAFSGAYIVRLLAIDDGPRADALGRLRNWIRRWWVTRRLGRYRTKSNALLVANAVAAAVGMEVALRHRGDRPAAL